MLETVFLKHFLFLNVNLCDLEQSCYNPKRRECILLNWMASESASGKRVIAHLDKIQNL